MSDEREALLQEEPAGHGAAESGSVRRRDIPQGRAVAEAMLKVFEDAEGLTGVPTVRPTDEKGSANWERAEKYWEDRYVRKTKDTVKNKFEALFWLIAAAIVLNSTDFFHVLYRDKRVVRSILNVALVGSTTFLGAIAYLVVRVGILAGVDWDKLYNARDVVKAAKDPFYRPVCNAVGVGAAAYVTAFLSFPIALWPVWSWWTIPILFVLGMALLMSMHFVPI